MSSVPTLRELKRVFIHDGKKLVDPDPSASAERVLELLSMVYPSLNNAVVDAPVARDGELQYKIKVNIGSKG